MLFEAVLYYLPFICLLVVPVVILWNRWPPGNFPPGSDGFPIWGSLPYIGDHLERSLAQWGWEHYGPVFYYTSFRTRTVVLNTFEAVTEGFIKRGDVTSGRPASGSNNLLFPDYTEAWKKQRAIRSFTIKKFARLDVGAVLAEQCAAMCQNFASVTKEINAADLITMPTFNVVTSLIFGRHDSSIQPETMIRPVYAEEACWFPGRSRLSELRIAALKAMISTWGLPEKQKDETSESQENCFTEEQLLDFLVDLLVAGTDTMATTVHWSLVFLASHPESQKKIHEEVDKVIGSHHPSMKFLSSMPYTRAAMQESIRMRPVFPLSIPHSTTDDVTIKGHLIPKGTQIVANLWAVQNDPKYWKEPESFHPERHLNRESGNFVKSNKIMSYSVGPRLCLGSQLASLHHFMFLVSLLQKFSFHRLRKQCDLKGVTRQLLAPLGVKLLVKHR